LDQRSQSASATPNSLASFKKFMTQKTGIAPSDQDFSAEPRGGVIF
jgi:hypothetical protein